MSISREKIVFLDALTLGNVKNKHLLEELGEYSEYETTLKDQRIDRIAGNTIVITNKVIIDRQVIDSCPDLKLICVAATGVNNIDLDYARKKNIEVKNVSGYSTESVAQSTFSMLFHLIHQNSYYDNYVKSGSYSKSSIFTHHGREFFELKGKKYGIIGMGNIGKRVAELATAFGMHVHCYSTSGKNKNTGYPSIPLEELLKSSDIISIHCPLNDKTINLIGKHELSKMKASAFLLNLGRGGIVDEHELAIALENSNIYGASLDVLTQEPIEAGNPLLRIKNQHKLFIAPHIAWASIESRTALIEKIKENIIEFLA